MIQAVSAFVNTSQEYGQPLPEVAATDNPSRDRNWLYDLIPSLKVAQQRLDAVSHGVRVPEVADCGMHVKSKVLLPAALDNMQRVRVALTVEEINMTVLAVRQIVASKPLSERTISLDAEWDTKTNRLGQVIASFKTALIQLGYWDSDGQISALLLQVFRHQSLPRALLALFGESLKLFVGVCVSGDLKRIGKDFKCTQCIENANFINLGSHARKRDVVHNGTASRLEKLVQLTLGEKLDKAPSVRLSRWSCSELCDAQKQYAALDALKSLEVYDQVQHLPDLTQRLLGEAATPNLHVDIVPAHGNVASMATRAAVGTLLDVSSCESPHGVTPRRVKPNQNSRVVKITSVDSPSLVVPGLKKVLNKEGVCLRDFGVPPFLIILPLKMLKHHVDSHLVRIFTDAELGSAAGENSDMYVATNTAPTRAAQPQPAIKHSQQCDALYFSETDDRFNHDTHGATNNIGDSDGDE
ncbi:hypothetical protein MHU86_10241 [Fragilaria crotonensis]|nr:hypothetical protein MHU86_10241 [Fragilaria crotonensis]